MEGGGHKLVCSVRTTFVHRGAQHLLWKRRNCASISSRWNHCYHKSWFTGLGYIDRPPHRRLAHVPLNPPPSLFLPTFCRGCGFQWRTMSLLGLFHFPLCIIYFSRPIFRVFFLPSLSICRGIFIQIKFVRVSFYFRYIVVNIRLINIKYRNIDRSLNKLIQKS